jgi:hypothetical protein
MVNSLPFREEKNQNGKYIRTFSESIPDSQLLWHWDEEDRIISPLDETDWKFQFDNMLPQKIEGEIKIPKGTWHRLIKGTGDLILQVEKNI